MPKRKQDRAALEKRLYRAGRRRCSVCGCRFMARGPGSVCGPCEGVPGSSARPPCLLPPPGQEERIARYRELVAAGQPLFPRGGR